MIKRFYLNKMLGEVDNQMKKGDYKAEVIFIGEIVGASNYVSDGELYAEILFNGGEHWELLSASPRHFITQACSQSVST
jgi:Ciliary basal body-associated, B9 protein